MSLSPLAPDLLCHIIMRNVARFSSPQLHTDFVTSSHIPSYKLSHIIHTMSHHRTHTYCATHSRASAQRHTHAYTHAHAHLRQKITRSELLHMDLHHHAHDDHDEVASKVAFPAPRPSSLPLWGSRALVLSLSRALAFSISGSLALSLSRSLALSLSRSLCLALTLPRFLASS